MMAALQFSSLFVIVAFFPLSFCKIYLPEGVPEINRNILGSNGPFRDFEESDCRAPFQNSWCQSDNPSFIYYWNDILKGCERVIYKGCGASRNNFLTLRDCETQTSFKCGRGSAPIKIQERNWPIKRNVEITESGRVEAAANEHSDERSQQEKSKKIREDTKSFIENEQKHCRKW